METENQHEDNNFQPSFEQVPIKYVNDARSRFLERVHDGWSEEIIQIELKEFETQLQAEADSKFLRPERDLWLYLQLIKVYIEAQMWEDAEEAFKEVWYVVEANGNGSEVFEMLHEELLSRLP